MNTEFDDMRQQLNIQKEKLQHQAIVNDQIFRRSMKRNVMSINRRYTFISILCILTIPYAYWAFVVMAGMSFYFWLATLVLMFVSFCYTIYNGRNLNSRLVERDLVDARMKVANAKKLDADWLMIGVPLAVIWFAYFVYEQYRISNGDDWKYMVTAGAVGAVVGLVIGLWLHFKIQSDYRQIIDEIDDFTSQSNLTR